MTLPLILILVFLGLPALTGLDVIRTPESEVREFSQVTWLAIVMFMPFFGPLAWFLSGRPRKGGLSLAGAIGPEDDEAFMKYLNAWGR